MIGLVSSVLYPYALRIGNALIAIGLSIAARNARAISGAVYCIELFFQLFVIAVFITRGDGNTRHEQHGNNQATFHVKNLSTKIAISVSSVTWKSEEPPKIFGGH